MEPDGQAATHVPQPLQRTSLMRAFFSYKKAMAL
jgi:hypothetical protein